MNEKAPLGLPGRNCSVCAGEVHLLLDSWEEPTTMSNPKFPRLNAKMVFPSNPSGVLGNIGP